MAAISIKFEGLDAVFKKLNTKTEDINEGISDELNAWALDTVTLAKQNCPVDEGFLRNSINANFSSPKKLEAEITVGANYGAYVEFGTRRYAAKYVATLPTDWRKLAATFKGKTAGQSFEQLVLNLVKWVKRKGIGATYDIKTRRRVRIGKQSAKTTMEADAYAIAIHIIRNGIKPQPYLFPAVNETRKQLIERIKKVIES